jgi:predicted nuclease of predicted toxin-antitoxin system
MKLLIDQNISKRIIDSIIDIFPGSMHIKDVQLSDYSDLEVWNYALKNNLILVSTDPEVFDRCVLSSNSPKTLYVVSETITTNKMEWALRINQEDIERFCIEDPASCLRIQV